MLLTLVLTVASAQVDAGAVVFQQLPDVVEPDAGLLEAPIDPPSALSLHGALEADLGVYPSGFPENGADFMAALRPILGFSVGDSFSIDLGPTFRLRIADTPYANRPSDVGGVLRGPDWDELSDYGQILQGLTVFKEGSTFWLRAGAMRTKTLGLGHLVWRYSNQTNPNYHPASAELGLRVGPIRAEVMASDALGARLFAGEVAWDMGGTFSADPQVKDRYVLAFSLAHDAQRAGLPFRADLGVTDVARPTPVTLFHFDFSAVFVRTANLKWMVLGGFGVRAIEQTDVGVVLGTSLDATVQEIGFSIRLEGRKQAGGFRHGFFGPMYELQRFADTGFRGTAIADVRLPDGFSAFAEVRVGFGTAVTFEGAAEWYFWQRLDLDGALSIALLDDWLYLTARTTMLGIGQAPRYSATGGLRWRFFPSFYVLAEAGTLFFPQPDGSLVRGVTASAGVGVDFER